MPEIGGQQRRSSRAGSPSVRYASSSVRTAKLWRSRAAAAGTQPAGRSPARLAVSGMRLARRLIQQPGADGGDAAAPAVGPAGRVGRGDAGSASARRSWSGAAAARGTCRTSRGARQRAEIGVEVGAVKRDRFADPHAGDEQQPEQVAERRRLVRDAQRAASLPSAPGSPRRCRGRGPRGVSVGQHVGGRHLDARIDFVQVARERRGPPAVASSASARRAPGSVAHASACSTVIWCGACGVQVIDELAAATARSLELVTRARDARPGTRRRTRAARSWLAPGHGRAICRERVAGRPSRRSRCIPRGGGGAPARPPASSRPREASPSRRYAAADAHGPDPAPPGPARRAPLRDSTGCEPTCGAAGARTQHVRVLRGPARARR